MRFAFGSASRGSYLINSFCCSKHVNIAWCGQRVILLLGHTGNRFYLWIFIESVIMKLAVSSYSLSRWRSENKKTLEDSIAVVGKMGVHAMEFSGITDSKFAKTKTPVEVAKRVLAATQKHGLEMAGYSVGGDLMVTGKKYKDEIARRKHEVDVAAALGAKTTRQDVTRGFPEKWKGGKTFAAALKVVVPALREVADYAQDKGVILTLENHGFYMQESARIAKLIDTVNHPNYRLTIDMGNFLCMNENPVYAVKNLLDYMVMAHVKDFHVRPKKQVPTAGWFMTPTPIALRGAIVGHGEIDIPAQLKLLKKAKYKGYLSLEFEGMEEPVKAINWGLDFLKRELEAIKALDKKK